MTSGAVPLAPALMARRPHKRQRKEDHRPPEQGQVDQHVPEVRERDHDPRHVRPRPLPAPAGAGTAGGPPRARARPPPPAFRPPPPPTPPAPRYHHPPRAPHAGRSARRLTARPPS